MIDAKNNFRASRRSRRRGARDRKTQNPRPSNTAAVKYIGPATCSGTGISETGNRPSEYDDHLSSGERLVDARQHLEAAKLRNRACRAPRSRGSAASARRRGCRRERAHAARDRARRGGETHHRRDRAGDGADDRVERAAPLHRRVDADVAQQRERAEQCGQRVHENAQDS